MTTIKPADVTLPPDRTGTFSHRNKTLTLLTRGMLESTTGLDANKEVEFHVANVDPCVLSVTRGQRNALCWQFTHLTVFRSRF